MDNFVYFRNALRTAFAGMKEHDLFTVAISKDLMWETYLNSFPEGTNPIYRERTHHDCQTCKQFIRQAGNIVTINPDDLTIQTIWDVGCRGFYQEVADKMSELIKSAQIRNKFTSPTVKIGAMETSTLREDKTIESFDHFAIEIPAELVESSGTERNSFYSDMESTYVVLSNGIERISRNAINTVLELINNNAIYKGAEYLSMIKSFKKIHNQAHKISNPIKRQRFLWLAIAHTNVTTCRIKNTSIGTLLMDLSNDVELEAAVRMYETKVAPLNYKRTSAVVTKAQIKKATDKVINLNLGSALDRRHAVIEDISINDVIFADRNVKAKMRDVDNDLSAIETLGEMLEASGEKVNLSAVDRAPEIHIDDFITDVIPRIDHLELLFEPSLTGNLFSLVAPAIPPEPSDPHLFKWDNGFSWAYRGDATDSIKERVKRAGGAVDGDIRASLSWFNRDDLDLHLNIRPDDPSIGGEYIYFHNKKSFITGANLDVDMNAGNPLVSDAVENICVPDRIRLHPGRHDLFVKNYNKRESTNIGFDIEIEIRGSITSISYPKIVRHKENVPVGAFVVDSNHNVTFESCLPIGSKNENIWGIDTDIFNPVTTMMLSPNHWCDENGVQKSIGNKHFFFTLNNCLNDEPVRGFYNEFLRDDLREHRKVFEILGAKTKAPVADRQLSGLGFSSTIAGANVIARTSTTIGKGSKMYRVIF